MNSRAVRPRLTVESRVTLVDEPVGLSFDGGPPLGRVRITASSTDADGIVHSAWAEYEAAADGSLRPASQPPLAGTYAGVDPFGLWWSMRSTPESPFANSLEPVPTTISAEAGGERLAEVEIERLRVGPTVSVEPVRDRGLAGMLFLPGRPAAPAVVVLGGSEGESFQAQQMAALLAGHGVAALALTYFGARGLPPEMADVPVEYVEEAVDWLGSRPDISAPKVGLVGSSRGGELALLVASACPRVGAIAAFSASTIVWPGVARGDVLRSAWTRGGRGVPFAIPIQAARNENAGGHTTLRGMFERALDEGCAVAAAEIPVERIAGPVLLVSGTDDRMWPSDRFGEVALGRLRARSRPYSDRHEVHPGAGHAFARPPGLPPSPTSIVHSFDGARYALGGNAAANARAAAVAWPRAIEFLQGALTRL